MKPNKISDCNDSVFHSSKSVLYYWIECYDLSAPVFLIKIIYTVVYHKTYELRAAVDVYVKTVQKNGCTYMVIYDNV